MRRWLGRGKAAQESTPAAASSGSASDGAAAPKGNVYQKRLEQYERELYGDVEDPCFSEEVERDLREDAFFKPVETATKEEIRENDELRASFEKSQMARFLLRSEELQAEEMARERLANAAPTRPEDAKLWKQLPLVPGPYGGPPIPRKALNTDEEVQGRFWDFFKQFQFGLWGYRQRPYPPERPIDVQQVLGYKWLDKRYADCECPILNTIYQCNVNAINPMQCFKPRFLAFFQLP